MERGIVSGRVAVLLRSTEVKPPFKRFVFFEKHPFFFLWCESEGFQGVLRFERFGLKAKGFKYSYELFKKVSSPEHAILQNILFKI